MSKDLEVKYETLKKAVSYLWERSYHDYVDVNSPFKKTHEREIEVNNSRKQSVNELVALPMWSYPIFFDYRSPMLLKEAFRFYFNRRPCVSSLSSVPKEVSEVIKKASVLKTLTYFNNPVIEKTIYGGYPVTCFEMEDGQRNEDWVSDVDYDRLRFLFKDKISSSSFLLTKISKSSWCEKTMTSVYTEDVSGFLFKRKYWFYDEFDRVDGHNYPNYSFRRDNGFRTPVWEVEEMEDKGILSTVRKSFMSNFTMKCHVIEFSDGNVLKITYPIYSPLKNLDLMSMGLVAAIRDVRHQTALKAEYRYNTSGMKASSDSMVYDFAIDLQHYLFEKKGIRKDKIPTHHRRFPSKAICGRTMEGSYEKYVLGSFGKCIRQEENRDGICRPIIDLLIFQQVMPEVEGVFSDKEKEYGGLDEVVEEEQKEEEEEEEEEESSSSFGIEDVNFGFTIL